MEVIKITDKKIIDFYKSNPQLNLITMNHLFIDILSQLSINLNSNIVDTINQQILTVVADIQKEVKAFPNTTLSKMQDIKKDYLADIKLLLSNTELTMHEKMSQMVEKNADQLFQKTSLVMSDLLPKSNEKTVETVDHCVKKHTDLIVQETARLIQSNPKDSQHHLSAIEEKFSSMIQNVISNIQTSENRTSQIIHLVGDRITAQKQTQDTIHNELAIFLNKYKNNSSVKGSISEVELYYMIQKIEPYDEIIRCSSEISCCDFRLKRRNPNRPTILFESKDYTASVNTEEVEKFERDLQIQKCHGIFISQNSPITYKEHFHIDIINGIIHLYISNVKYDCEILKTAIHIVDNLSEKLMDIQLFADNGGRHLSEIEMNELKEEYTLFANRKTELLEQIKSFNKFMTDKLNELQLPIYKKMCGVETNPNGIICNICNNFWGKNQASVSAHKKKCAKLNGFIEIPSSPPSPPPASKPKKTKQPK